MKETKTPLHDRDLTSQELAIQFDAQEFVHLLANCDLTEEQKLEYIRTIWTIVLPFVDMGFGLHPIQQACGQLSEAGALCSDADVLASPRSDVCRDFERTGRSLSSKRVPTKQKRGKRCKQTTDQSKI